MSIPIPRIFHAVRSYAAEFRAVRDEIRTERIMNSLPERIHRDIGWPEIYIGRQAGRYRTRR